MALNLYLGLGMRHEEDMNVKSAVLHMLGDAAASAGVIVGGIIIAFTHSYVIDPILSVLIALLIAFGAWRIVRQTVVILMEGTPYDVDLSKVIEAVRSVSGVQNVHDLHVWTITSGTNALSCHIELNGTTTITDSQSILQEIEHRLAHLNICHVTVQTEDQNHPHDDDLLCGTIENHH
jgi:cobalt-zinc-cadmium efflux system protein